MCIAQVVQSQKTKNPSFQSIKIKILFHEAEDVIDTFITIVTTQKKKKKKKKQAEEINPFL